MTFLHCAAKKSPEMTSMSETSAPETDFAAPADPMIEEAPPAPMDTFQPQEFVSPPKRHHKKARRTARAHQQEISSAPVIQTAPQEKPKMKERTEPEVKKKEEVSENQAGFPTGKVIIGLLLLACLAGGGAMAYRKFS